MRYLSLFILAWLIQPELNAQSGLLLFGRVVANDTPVAQARVIQKGALKATRTDEDGFFKIPLTRWPTDLVIAHPRYETQQSYVARDTVEIDLEPLRPARNQTMEKDEMRSFDRLASRVLDFRFYDQMLLILGNSGREMRLINQRGVLKERFLTPTKMLGIARDCLGGLHAYSRDSAYSIYYDYEELHFLNPLAINEFEELVLPCRCYFQGGLIYTISKKRDLITSVQYANKSIVATIKEIKDSSALQFLNENYGREYFTGRGRSADMSKGFLGQLSDEQLAQLQEEANIRWFDSYLLKPNKVYAFSTASELKLFDLKKMKQYTYTNVNQPPTSSILHFKAEDAQRMLQDRVNGQLYLLYENRGRIQLQPIDDTKESYNIDEFPFPSKLQIHRGQVYFTSNPAMDGSNFLFRMNQ